MAESWLRNADIRATSARINVLASLLNASRALTHQEIQDNLTDMDRVTLYRALDCLTDAGLAHKIAGDDRVYRYSAGTEHGEASDGNPAATAAHQHSHFKCTRCSKVFCLDSSDDAKLLEGSVLASGVDASKWRKQLQNMLQHTLGKGFQSHDIELTIKGWCAECAH